MFKKVFRLNSRQFTQVFKKGNILFSHFFRMKHLPSQRLSVAVVIPKKILKKRVDRNKEKRRITHLLKNPSFLGEKASGSYVFWITKDTRAVTPSSLGDDLSFLFSKITRS